MKTLFLIRHAKSDWAVEQLSDYDRPLNDRGYADAIKMSQYMAKKKFIPDVVITSPAIRAISTALIFSRNLEYKASDLFICPELYDSSLKKYLKVIANIEKSAKTAFVFGHNPVISSCVHKLSGNFDEVMPTCAVVGLQADVTNWADFSTSKVNLFHFDFPKQIKQ